MNQLKILLLFSFLILSCEQNPLNDIPKINRGGTLYPGYEHSHFFEKPFVIVKVHGQSNRMMEFEEGKKNTYKIEVTLTYKKGSKYEIQWDYKDFTNLLEKPEDGSGNWTFDEENENVATFTWKPSKIFTKNKPFRHFSLSLLVKFMDHSSSSKNPSFVIKRDINVIVHKNLDQPEIYKISTDYDNYEKLDDGYFYTNSGAEFLELKHYDKLFFDDKQKEPLEKFNYLRFYGRAVYNKNPSKTGNGNALEIYDKHGESIPYILLGFVKQPFYYKDKEKTGRGCYLGMEDIVRENKAVCLTEVGEKPITFKQDIYVKHYKIPDTVELEDLFYKVESQRLCNHYANNKMGKIEVPCYLPLNGDHHSINRGHVRVKKNEDIYLLTNNQLELVDKSNWEGYFHRIPEFIKWQMGGYRPFNQGKPLEIVLTEGVVFKFDVYVKDYNYLGAPELVNYQEENDKLLWMSKDIDIHWSFSSAESLKGNKWKLSYILNVEPLNNKNKNVYPFNHFKINLQPVSKLIAGTPVSFAFDILPSVKKNLLEYFDPETDVKLSKTVENNNGIKQWISSGMAFSSQIKIQYVLPGDFIQKLIDHVLPDEKTLFWDYYHDYKEKEEVLKYLKIEEAKPRSNYNCSDQSSNNYCKCSPFEKIQGDNQNNSIYIESTCSYRFSLQTDHKQLRTLIEKDKSAYFFYDSKVAISRPNISLINTFFDHNTKEDIVMNIVEGEVIVRREEKEQTDFSSGIDGNDFYEGKRIHIFFNLKPEPYIKCFSQHTSSNNRKKICTIHYPLTALNGNSLIKNNASLLDLKNEKNLGIEVHLPFCEKLAENCSCEQIIFSANGMNIQCLFEESSTVSPSVYLKTDNPYVYFLNTDANYDGKESYKRTPEYIFFGSQ